MKKLKNQKLTDVRNLAQKLAKTYKTKDVIIGLIGPLGAGKTAFVKEFAKQFGINKIKSPTYIVGAVYPIPNRKLYHYDFYRLEHEKQLRDIGLTEALGLKHRIILIEWVDKFPNIKQYCDLILNLEIIDKQTRNVTII